MIDTSATPTVATGTRIWANPVFVVDLGILPPFQMQRTLDAAVAVETALPFIAMID